jgi:hypothetical protein
MSFKDSSSTFEQLQEHVRKCLDGHELLIGADVISRHKGDIESMIKQQLHRLGLAIVVLAPVGSDIKGNYGAPYFDRVDVQIHCVEIPTTNNTGYSALEAAERVLRALHLKSIVLDCGQKALLVAERLEPVEDSKSVNFVVANFTTQLGLAAYSN